jgi:hypothetical protein
MYHLNNLGGEGCEGGVAALTSPIFPYFLRRYERTMLFVHDGTICLCLKLKNKYNNRHLTALNAELFTIFDGVAALSSINPDSLLPEITAAGCH